MEQLGTKLGFKDLEDWYTISTKDFCRRRRGAEILRKYSGIFPTLSQIFPEHQWLPWKLGRVPTQFWEVEKNRRTFMEWLGVQLGLQSMNGWYSVTGKVIEKHGGGALVYRYGDSPSRLIVGVFPDHSWDPGKFTNVPKGHWEERFQREPRQSIEWLEKEMRIRRLEDWYRVSASQISQLVPLAVFRESSLGELLKVAHPEHQWDPTKLLQKKGVPIRASQRYLAALVQEIFPKSGELEGRLTR